MAGLVLAISIVGRYARLIGIAGTGPGDDAKTI
jgi:hypothetical protein